MAIKIIADSSQDIDQEIRTNHELNVELVPFKLYIDEHEYIDDDRLDVLNFINKMTESKSVPRTACPSPNDFFTKLNDSVDNFIVTISSKLSGTFNSAQLAVNMFLEEFPKGFAHVFDSKSACCAETLVSIKINDLFNQGKTKEEIVTTVEKYIDEMSTLFILESLDNLMKNGRMSKLKGIVATVLKIKPIMTTDSEGEIQLKDKVRGSDKAFDRLVELIIESSKGSENKILAISHVNNLERANWLKSKIETSCSFKEIIVVQTMGLSSLYADNKGIIVCY